MNAKLQWYDRKSEKWIYIDPQKHISLAKEERYRILDTSFGVNVFLSGDQFDPTILKDMTSFSYWAGYYEVRFDERWDADAYHDGRMDAKYGSKEEDE